MSYFICEFLPCCSYILGRAPHTCFCIAPRSVLNLSCVRFNWPGCGTAVAVANLTLLFRDVRDYGGGIFGILCLTGCDAVLFCTYVSNDRISSSSWSGCERLLDPEFEGQST